MLTLSEESMILNGVDIPCFLSTEIDSLPAGGAPFSFNGYGVGRYFAPNFGNDNEDSALYGRILHSNSSWFSPFI
jgi:hypothetical protein